MVFCKLLEPSINDFGTRFVRVPAEMLDKLVIDDGEIIEIIFNQKRFGVIAQLDNSIIDINEMVKDNNDDISEKTSVNENKSEETIKSEPIPQGMPFKEQDNVDYSHAIGIRLDGEVRLSLGISIDDLVELDTILKPQFVRKVFINFLGMKNEEISPEELQEIITELKQQNSKPITAGLILNIHHGYQKHQIIISDLEPDGIGLISHETEVSLNMDYNTDLLDYFSYSYEKIGGYRTVIAELRKLVEIPIKHPEIFKSINLSAPQGILISGPVGVGKTLMVHALAEEAGAELRELPGNLFSGIGITERNIREFFSKIKLDSRNKSIIILLDKLDTLTPAPHVNQAEYERRFNIQFALAIDSIKNSTNIIIIGVCNSVNDVDPILRRSGRFDTEIEMHVPSEEERKDIFEVLLRPIPLADDISIEKIRILAKRMIGFVGADINSVIREACMIAIRRNSPRFLEFTKIPMALLKTIKIEINDLEAAFKVVDPSGMQSFKIQLPNVHWSDIGGLKSIKKTLKEHVEWQFKYPQILAEMGVKAPRGMLLYGPPGNGKTLLAKAIATEIQANFISIKGPELLSVYFSESAKKIRELFAKARKLTPSIIFFDEIDAIAPRRGGDQTEGGREIDSTVNQLLTLLDGVETNSGIFILGATNRPGAIDPALLRPGRIDRLMLIPQPDENARKQILKIHTENIQLMGNREKIIEALAEKTEGFSGADLENLCRESVLTSLREDFSNRKISESHFLTALETVNPSVDPKLISYYDKFASTIIGAIRLPPIESKSLEFR